MKAYELIAALEQWADSTADYSNTCDTVKCGNPEKDVKKIAVTMFATPDVIRMAANWGAGLLITHEPTFYDHLDKKLENDPVTETKSELLRQSGLVLYRFHDHPHQHIPDMISEGGLRRLGLRCKSFKTVQYGGSRIVLETPMTPRDIGRLLQDRMNIAQPRMSGALDQECTRVSLWFGTPGGGFEELRNPETDLLLIGEACEWMLGEYARDAAQLGFRKSLIIMGHAGSERAGMHFLADKLKSIAPNCEARYFECGEVCSYPR